MKQNLAELLKTKEGRARVRWDAINTHAAIMRNLDDMDFEEEEREKAKKTPIVPE